MADEEPIIVEFSLGGARRGVSLLTEGHPLLAKMAGRHFKSMWRSVDRAIQSFTERQFETGGRATVRGGYGGREKRAWRELAISTVRHRRKKDRVNRDGYYTQATRQGPDRRIGMWTGRTREAFIHAPVRISEKGRRFEKTMSKFPGTVFHHGATRAHPQPPRRVWNTAPMREIVLQAWADWLDWAKRNAF